MKVKIDVSIYSTSVFFTTCEDTFKKMYKNYSGDPFVTVEYKGDIYVLVTDEWNNMHDHRFIQCLSHEMNHAAMCILYWSGVNFDYKNQEALCYLQDYLVAKAFKAINKALSD